MTVLVKSVLQFDRFDHPRVFVLIATSQQAASCPRWYYQLRRFHQTTYITHFHISRDNPPNSRNKQKTITDLTNVTKICKYHLLSPLWVSLQLFQAFSFLLCWTELQQRRLGLLHKRGISLAFYNMWFIINTKVGTLFLSASSFSLFIKYQDQPLSLVSSQLLNGAPLAGSSPPAKVLEILWINPLQFNLSGHPPSLLFISKAAMTSCSYKTTK